LGIHIEIDAEAWYEILIVSPSTDPIRLLNCYYCKKAQDITEFRKVFIIYKETYYCSIVEQDFNTESDYIFL